VRLLSDKYDIPQPYTTAPRPHTVGLLATYRTAVATAMRAAAALDALATATSTSTSVLAATRRTSPESWPDHHHQHNP
jgi:hypothetical protein